jgi:hypothetical protein
MLPPIQLHDETSFDATKVNDELTYWMLAAKLNTTKLPTAQLRPQFPFDVCLTFSKLSRPAFVWHRIARHKLPSP